MADPITLDDIYALFRTSQAEADRRFAESDRRSAEADRRSAELDHRVEEAYALLRASQAEADRRFAEIQAAAERRNVESERQLTELKRIVAHTSREVAGLTTRWGQFVENLVAPAVVRLFQERGIEVQEISRRMQSKRPGAQMEIDIFAVNGDVAVAIEVKSRLSRQDVQDFLERLGRFRQAFPHYEDYRIYGAVAGIEIDEGVDRYAYQQGLFVIRQTGETVAIVNDGAFRPAAW